MLDRTLSLEYFVLMSTKTQSVSVPTNEGSDSPSVNVMNMGSNTTGPLNMYMFVSDDSSEDIVDLSKQYSSTGPLIG